MSSRTLNAAAILLGAGVVVVLGAISLRPRPPRLEVLGQTVQPIAGRGRCVVIDVAGPRWRDRMPLAEGRGLRIVDASGRAIPFETRLMDGLGAPPSLVVRGGYRDVIVAPRLELWREGRRVASTGLGAFPTPVANDLRPTEPPLFRCSLRRYGKEAPILVSVAPTKPLLNDEAWVLHLVGTRHAVGLDSWTSLTPGSPDGATLEVPYAEQAGAVEVEVHRFQGDVKTDAISIPNLVLIDVNGQTALKVDGERDLGLHFGVHLYLQAGAPGPPKRTPEPDRRQPFGFVGTKGQPYVAPRHSPVEPPSTLRAELSVPAFERLNVRSLVLSLTPAGLPPTVQLRRDEPRGPVSTQPFDAVLRVLQTTWRPIDRVRQVVAIEAAR